MKGTVNKPTIDMIEMGLRGKALDTLLTGWSFKVEELSSNFYRVSGVDGSGVHLSHMGTGPVDALEACLIHAQRIDRRRRMIAEVRARIKRLITRGRS